MSEQPVSEADLQAYADGKLPEERRAAVAAWLAAHPEDAERIESYRQLAAELRSSYDSVLDEPVPERLERALRAGRVRHLAMVAGWVAIGLVIGAIAGWQLHGARPALAPTPVRPAVPTGWPLSTAGRATESGRCAAPCGDWRV